MTISAGHQFDPSVLREYDVRGVVGKTLHVADARALGKAFGTTVRRSGGKRVAVGRDGRLSSPELADALVDGIAATGCDVVRVGRGPTPMLYFTVYDQKTDAGIMVTGSHNPSDYNGFKMLNAGKSVFGEAIQELGRIAAKGDFETGAGSVTDIDIEDRYVERLLAELDCDVAKPMTIVWDCGNGAAGDVVRKLTAKLPGNHHLLFDEIDGTFPNHHPDPTVEANLVDLKALVAKLDADWGVAFDGDGDRIGVVDGQGRVLWGDQLLQIYAADVLGRLPGASIIADVKASQTLFDEVTRLGGDAIMWKTGHSLIKTKMVEAKAPIAGEMSGHIFFAERYYGYDDAMYAAIRLYRILVQSGKSLDAWRDAMPVAVNTPETRIECSDDRKFALIEEVRARLSEAGAEVSGIDGVRVSTEDGWWLLRASNTQPAIVARCEAADEAGLDRLKSQVTAQLQKSGLSSDDFFAPGGGH
ncbi:phosphoglucomutase/phosphomannomutase PgmG [Thalassospira alkalitolerans]|uniref:Phosphomannomutase n=1 Tax=Thalassospira alkalitolerans TaxID=1293890 RepID=A0A1Y2L709_9PROT|nr:phosphomannomutase/phosphoglucomutase [Thalassospira alkalitolerans]OSQ44862.1 phosphomannomutase [Thalassospira alkalitolerans]